MEITRNTKVIKTILARRKDGLISLKILTFHTVLKEKKILHKNQNTSLFIFFQIKLSAER